MKFIVTGVNHETKNLDQRKYFHFRDSDKLSFSTQLLDKHIHQVLILSTCNRSEVYAIADDVFDENNLRKAFFSYFHQECDQGRVLVDEEALLHLLEVACGLQSMVIGEDQILHQIKEALTWSMEQHFSGKELNYIFQNVIKFAKDMRSEYAISEHPLSVSYIGYLFLKEYLKKDDKVMIAGIGEMSQLMIEYLKDYEIYIVNRTYNKVVPFLNDKRHYVDFEHRYEYLDKVNAVVSATASPHTIFNKDKLDENHPLVFLDLAMPRDIDSEIKNMHNMRLVDMDDLQLISEKHLKKRKEICEIIRSECQKQVDVMIRDLKLMKSDSLIQQLQKRYMDLSDETYELLIRKLSLNSKEQYILKKVLKTSFLRLMKEPVQVLKNKDVDEMEQYIELVTTLFDLKENNDEDYNSK